MGTYDTPAGVIDDENQTGRITGSLLNFPTEYTFSVVGKTPTTSAATTNNNDNGGEDYANSVKFALTSILGSDVKIELRVVPRGTKFTRVSAKVTVDSANIISSIYEELGALDGTVMKYWALLIYDVFDQSGNDSHISSGSWMHDRRTDIGIGKREMIC